MQYVVNSEPQRGECPFEQPHKARLCLPLSMEMRPCLLARYWTGWDRFLTKPLISLALPRGLEPLFSP
jgi:hypothetical protein